MKEPIVPADEPIVERVLEWTIARDSEDIGILMKWIGDANKKRERERIKRERKSLHQKRRVE